MPTTTRSVRAVPGAAAAAVALALALAPAALPAQEDQTPAEPPASAMGAFAGALPEAPRPDAAQTARIGLVVDASDPARLVNLLRAQGLRADLDTSGSTPAIISAAEGANFAILFYGCTNGQNCRAIQFVSGFSMNNPPGLQRINEWNAGRIVGQAFIAQNGAIRIAHYVAMRDGMTEANFGFTVEQWRIALRDFMAHIGFS